MQNRRQSDKTQDFFASCTIARVRTVESKERIALPPVVIAWDRQGGWMLQSGLVGAQTFLSTLRGPGTRFAVSPPH
jgi:hypothetical protein